MKHKNSLLKSDELSVFCEQLSLLMNGGVSVYDGIYLMYSEAEEGKDKQLLSSLNAAINNNIPLYQALEETGAFPDYMVHIINVGERTGHLEEVLSSLASYYERDGRLKAKIKSAVTYPLVLFMIIVCIVAVLVANILPMFERMFKELQSEISTSTTGTIEAGLMAGRVAAIIVGVLLVIILTLIIMGFNKKGNKLLRRIFAQKGPIGDLLKLIATGRFVSSISMMLSSGMDVTDGLERELEACDNAEVAGRIRKCLELYNDHNSLDESIAQSQILTGMDARLLSVAARTGGADEALERIGIRYDSQIGDRVTRMTTIVETILVTSLMIMVGSVLVAVMVPLANLIAAVG